MPWKLAWPSGNPIRPPPGAGLAHTGRRACSASAIALVPRAGGVEVGAGDHHRVLRRRQANGEVGDRAGIADRAAADRALDRRADLAVVGLGLPVVHRDREEARPAGRQRGVVDRAPERGRDVLGAWRLVAPLDERLGNDDRVAVGQVGLHRHHRAHLLPCGDHERRLVRLGVEDRADGVAHAGCGVEVDERRLAARLGVSVGHADDRRLLQAEHVVEVARVLGEHRQLGRAGVAEHRRHAALTQQLEGGLANVHWRDPNRRNPSRARRRRSRGGCAAPR